MGIYVPPKEISPEELEEVRHLRATNSATYNWNRLGRMFGHHADTLRRRIDPSFLDDRKGRARRATQAKRPGPACRETDPITDEELKTRKALIPMDVRDLTGRICGDPIPNDPRRSV
jgi:hypothetical protein